MAEAVASGIAIGTLATGITSSVIKLRSIWDQVQDAPDDIRDLIEELEVLSYMVANTEELQQRNPVPSLLFDSTSISHCLRLCKQRADRLKELTDDLSKDLEQSKKLKRKRAAVKIVLKKDQIDRHKARVERAIRMLNSSLQVYTIALQQLLPDIIVAKFSNLAAQNTSRTALYECFDLDQPFASCREATNLDKSAGSEIVPTHYGQAWSNSSLFGMLRYQKRCYAKYNSGELIGCSKVQEIEEIIAEYWTPSWIAKRLWRLQYSKAFSCWKLCFQTYNIISEDSLAFLYTEENDLEGLRELFSRKLASPFDCDFNGFTLLLTAIVCRSWDVCRFLITEGADLNYRDDGRAALDLFEFFDGDAMDTSGLGRLLLAKTDREVDLEKFYGSSRGFSDWQQIVDPLYYQRPFNERFAVASSLMESNNRPDVVRQALSLGPLPPLTYFQGGSLLIHIANWAGSFVTWDNAYSRGWFSSRTSDTWKPFLRELIGNGAPLHYIDSFPSTPLLQLIISSAKYLYDWEYLDTFISPDLPIVLSTWLEGLQECGVNLKEYGEEEVRLHDQDLVSWSWGYAKWTSLFVLKDLTYGPLPSDWKVTIAVEDEEPAKMPGGWIEDDDHDDEDD